MCVHSSLFMCVVVSVFLLLQTAPEEGERSPFQEGDLETGRMDVHDPLLDEPKFFELHG